MKKMIIANLLLIVLIHNTYAEDNYEEDYYYIQGETKIAEKDYLGAIQYFNEAINRCPNNELDSDIEIV